MPKKRNHQWQRVVGTGETAREKRLRTRNTATLKSETFLDACSKAGVEPTRRQASKYNRKRGVAYYGR